MTSNRTRRLCRTAALLLIGALTAAGVGSRVLQGAPAPQQVAGDISPQALAQIEALLQEKQSWTPVQRKIDSQLLLPVKRARNEAIAAGVPAMESALQLEGDGRIVIDVRANVTDQLLLAVRTMGAEVISSHPQYRDMQLRVTPAQVESIAALPDVIFIQPKQDLLTQMQHALQSGVLTNSGNVTSQGDATHRAAEARAAFAGADGTGVKIGVLSNGVVGLAESQASGDLPPTCTTPLPAGACVTVLPGQAGPTTTGNGGAEGTAMLEIVHDLAPGAKLFFATGVTGLSTFAQNIRDLRFIHGCDIIVDDIGYFVESPFQDGQSGGIISTTNGGVVIQAVKDVAADGAMFFSAAANSGNLNDGTSGTWEGDFADGGATSAPLIAAGRVHSFGARTYNVLTLPGSANNLFWSDPLGGSSNDYDLFRLSSDGQIVLAASINVQNGTQDPYEQVSSGATNDRLVIAKYSGATRFLHLGTLRGRLAMATRGETHGHSATTEPNSFGVAAAAALAPGPNPNPFNGSNGVETFSSDGPRRIFFNSAGQPITPGNLGSAGGQVLSKPDFTAADRVNVTGNGGFSPTFTGTSAAAPHAAAIAALMKSRGLSTAQVRTELFNSAIDIEDAGVDFDSGAGIIMALSTAPTGSTAPSITTHPQSQAIPTSTSATLNVVATGTNPLTFQWYQGLTGDTSSPIGGATSPRFTTPALTSTTNYWVRVTGAVAPAADSDTAQITIAASSAPVITSQPQSIGVLSGQSASLGVVASGTGLSYQWYQGSSGDVSTPIAGAIFAGITTPPLTIATNFWVRVSNSASTTTDSATATVSIGIGPNISGQPASQTVSCGQPATLSVAASGTAPLTFQWFAGVTGDRTSPIAGATSSSFTTPALGASASYWVRVSNPYDSTSSTTATITVTPSPNCVQAIYDATLKAPKCAIAGSVCDAGNLVQGRDLMIAGPEPNQPNTILNSCADGSGGTFHVDESIDFLRVSTTDGSPIAPGKTIRIEATVWAFAPASDQLDFYSAPDATNPVWTFLGTVAPTGPDAQTLSVTFTLPAGRLQAVRAQFRFGGVGGAASTCTAGSFNDRDDLIFAAGNMVANGDFTSGLASWQVFEPPDIVHNNATGGEFRYHIANPITASGQVVVFQNTGLTVPSSTPLIASFQIGNNDTALKRMTVLIGDSDFGDLAVCTFWLPANAPMRTYQMKTHTTKDVANASIYFYASSLGTGDYRLDDVAMNYDPTGSLTRTDCLDPIAPSTGGAASANLLVNGDFGSGVLPWQTFFDVASQLSSGVFEFVRPAPGSTQAGGVLQATGQTMATGQVVSASFQLGNSSAVRKRVAVLLHDLDFTDLSACTFWLAPNQPLSTYTMRGYASKAWTNATLTFYAATIGNETWMRLDNATLQRSSSTVQGTECIEPTPGPEADGGGGGVAAEDPASNARRRDIDGGRVAIDGGRVFRPGNSDRGTIIHVADSLDLTEATNAHLVFDSWLQSRDGEGRVQVSLDGETWVTVATVGPATEWQTIHVDLSEFAGKVVYLRFSFEPTPAMIGVEPDRWLIVRRAGL